jgi:polyhydroxyalkanoate synthesis regulator phasin
LEEIMSVGIDASVVFSGISAVGVVGGIICVSLALRKDRRDTKEARDKEIKVREEEVKAHAETWTNLTRDVSEVKSDISEIKKTLGNGGYKGIKGDIEAIKSNCGVEMATLKKQVEFNTPRIDHLECRVNDIERDK